MEKTKNELKQEIYSSSLPPDFAVVVRIKATFYALQEASKHGAKADRDSLAREIANLTDIKKSIQPKVWKNL